MTSRERLENLKQTLRGGSTVTFGYSPDYDKFYARVTPSKGAQITFLYSFFSTLLAAIDSMDTVCDPKLYQNSEPNENTMADLVGPRRSSG
jgi:hypothetical protein